MDHKAWKQLIMEQLAQHGALHFRTAYRILGNHEAAEDACQQAYIKAILSREDVRDPGSLGGWIIRVIVRECLSVLRRRKTERRAMKSGQFNSQEPPEPGDQLANREATLYALDELDEPTRTIVVLRVMQEKSGKEVSRLLSCSESEVSRKLHRGLGQMREVLRRECEVGSASAKHENRNDTK